MCRKNTYLPEIPITKTVAGIWGVLRLTSIAGLFVAPDRLALSEIPPEGLSTWTWGKKLVGLSRGKRFLTNGEPDTTFAGCPWIPEWDGREGYLLVPWDRFPNYAFVVSALDVVFVGHPEVSGSEAHPAKVAIPKSALPEGMSEPFPQCDGSTRTFRLDKKVLLGAVAKHFPIAFSLLDEYGCRTPRFYPLRSLSRSEWRELGFHVFTNEETTSTQVVPFTRPGDLSFPCSAMEELPAFGVRGIPQGAIDGDRVQLVLRQFEIVDPERAAKAFPPARVMNPGDIVINGGINSSWWFIDQKDCDALGSLPKRVCITGGGNIALPNLKGVASNGTRPLRVVHRNIRSEETECLMVDSSLMESSLVSARKASARYVIPSEIPRYQVFINGDKVSDRYYLLADLTQLTQLVSKKATLKKREAGLIEQFGDFLPQGWQRMSDEVGQRARWRKLREVDGWRGANAFADGMGIADGDSFGNWLQSIGWANASYPLAGETLYAPIRWNEVIEHAEFATLFMEVVGRYSSFVQRTMFDENARTKVFAKVLAS